VRTASAQGADQAPLHGRQVHAAQFQSILSTKNKRGVSKSSTELGETALRTLDGVVQREDVHALPVRHVRAGGEGHQVS
jgi:site-specific recombinase XerC